MSRLVHWYVRQWRGGPRQTNRFVLLGALSGILWVCIAWSVLEAWCMGGDIYIDVDQAGELALSVWEWIPMQKWARQRGHVYRTVRLKIANHELVGVQDESKRRWILEPV